MKERSAQENCKLACGARVIKGSGQTRYKSYDRALLSEMHAEGANKGIADATMTDGKREQRRRVSFIGKRLKPVLIAAALVIALLGITGLMGCSDGIELQKIEPSALISASPAPTPVQTLNAASEPTPRQNAETQPPFASPELELENYFSDRAGADEDVRAALYEHFLAERSERFLELLEKGYLINIYAVRGLGNGTLALSDFAYEGEMFPDLFYIENGAVVSRTRGTDPWSVHYTRLMGSTVVYGRSFAWDGGILASTHADASFLNGLTDNAKMPVTAGKDDTITGFVFIADGDTWLSSLSIYDGDTLVTDDHDYQFQYSDITAETIFARTRFMPMYTDKTWARHVENTPDVALLVDGQRYGLGALYKETGALLADAWRTSEQFLMPLTVAPDMSLALQGLDADDILRLYLVDLRLDDGSEDGMEKCLGEPLELLGGSKYDSETGLAFAAPAKTGLYAIVIETSDAYYAQGVSVEK